jgi:hypothetical protein
MQALVAAGWFRSLDEIVVDAIRRYVESHRGELMDELIREDVEWGLRGTDVIGGERPENSLSSPQG